MNTENRSKKGADDTDDFVIAKFHVFKGKEYLGWDCFSRKRVMVGSSSQADLVLPGDCGVDSKVDGIWALFTISSKGVLVEDFSVDKQILVKGRSVGACMLGPLDFVTIGPYSIKIKLSRISEEAGSDNTASFSKWANLGPEPLEKFGRKKPPFEATTSQGQIEESRHEFIEELAPSVDSWIEEEILKNEIPKEIEAIDLNSVAEPVLPAVDKRQVKSSDFFNYFRQAGFITTYNDVAPQDPLELVLSDSDPDNDGSPQVNIEVVEEIDIEPETRLNTEKVVSMAAFHDETSVSDNLSYFRTPTPFLPEDLEAAEEDDDIEAEFDLKDILNPGSDAQTTGEPVLEVVKTWDDTVIDIKFLDAGEKYFSLSNGRKFRLAEQKKGKFYYYFNDRFTGFISEKDAGELNIESLKKQSKLVSRRKKIFRCELSHDAEIRFSDDSFDYLVRPGVRMKSPEVFLPPSEKSTFKKNLLQSSSFHIVFMMVLGFFFSLPTIKQAPLPESRFVKVDMSQFVKQEQPKVVKKKEVVKKEVKKPTPKPEKKAVKIKSPKRKKKVAKRRKAKPKVVAGRKLTPKGGSTKKGNVVKKDVNQTGMLAILGKSGITLQPSVAMAAVTNLDAVSTDTDRGGYKVSGVVASLGDTKVELPSSGGIVDTQGSATVLRSGDQIASLDAGTTGQGQVQSLVTATLDRNVMVKGGISREDVKRVIDQHIDEIQYCYESALINNPSIMGKLVLEWKILNDGRVGEIPIKSSTLNSSAITSCVKKSIKSWRFPEPEGTESVIVSYPFIFDIVGF